MWTVVLVCYDDVFLATPIICNIVCCASHTALSERRFTSRPMNCGVPSKTSILSVLCEALLGHAVHCHGRTERALTHGSRENSWSGHGYVSEFALWFVSCWCCTRSCPNFSGQLFCQKHRRQQTIHECETLHKEVLITLVAKTCPISEKAQRNHVQLHWASAKFVLGRLNVLEMRFRWQWPAQGLQL